MHKKIKNELNRKRTLSGKKRIVVKIGTNSLSSTSGQINQKAIIRLVSMISKLKKFSQTEVILVTSGAIGAGLAGLGFKHRPDSLAELQMAAAVGQSKLMSYYDRYFTDKKISSAQILLTHDDIKNKVRSKNIAKLFDLLLSSGVVPVVNENDAVSVDEIRVGDNDSLACMVAILAKADLLIFITNSDGVLTNIKDKNSRLPLIRTVNKKIMDLAIGKTNQNSTGGMQTKLLAAKKASNHKIPSLIINASQISKLEIALKSSSIGTLISK